MKSKAGFYETDTYHCLGIIDNQDIDLRLNYCGYEQCESGHRFGPNRRDCYVLHVVTQGKGKLEIAGQCYRLTEGDAFLIRPHEEAWYTADRISPWTYLWIGFQGMKADECVMRAGFDHHNHIIHNIHHGPLFGYIMEMLNTRELTYSNALIRSGYLQMFLAQLMKQQESQYPDMKKLENEPGTAQVKRLVQYFVEHYSQNLRMNEIAQEMGVNRTYLASRFKKVTGYSPTEYLMRLRMEKAKSLLRTTNYSVGQIAAMVGYADQLAFSRMFKHRFGESPKTFRKEADELVICHEKVAVEESLVGK